MYTDRPSRESCLVTKKSSYGKQAAGSSPEDSPFLLVVLLILAQAFTEAHGTRCPHSGGEAVAPPPLSAPCSLEVLCSGEAGFSAPRFSYSAQAACSCAARFLLSSPRQVVSRRRRTPTSPLSQHRAASVRPVVAGQLSAEPNSILIAECEVTYCIYKITCFVAKRRNVNLVLLPHWTPHPHPHG